MGRVVQYDGNPSYYQDSNIVWIANDESCVINDFLKYWYSIVRWPVSKGGTIGRLYGKDIKKVLIPVPSLEVQERIVSILDRFDALTTSLADGLPAEIEARRKQYEYYRDKLLDFPRKESA